MVNNEPESVTRVHHGYSAQYDESTWRKIRAESAKRGSTQKGIPRARIRLSTRWRPAWWI